MQDSATNANADGDSPTGGSTPPPTTNTHLTVNPPAAQGGAPLQRAPSPLSVEARETVITRSNTAPVPQWKAQLSPKISPGGSPGISPGGRDRGYSLRRTIFSKTGGPQSNITPDIELAQTGDGAHDGYPFPETTTKYDKKEDSADVDVADITITASSSASIPLKNVSTPEPKKKNTKGGALPGYTRWIQQQRKEGGALKKVEDVWEKAYKEGMKRIFGIQDVPPSKDGRHIYLDPMGRRPVIDERTQRDYVGNSIRSSRYTLWNFLPKQLFYQFTKLANFYFLCISIMQLIPGLSTTGTFTTIVPLLCFVTLSMAKEGYDDIRRYKMDKTENRKITKVLKSYDASRQPAEGEVDGDQHWQDRMWQDIRVGDIVKLSRDDEVPADIVLLHSDGLNNVAYIETMALDGETNLKAKQPSPIVAERCNGLDAIAACDALFVVEDPNMDLYNFDGRVQVDGETLPLTMTEVVYRGSTLRNTNMAIGMVVNTGEECKIRMNANKNPRTKAPTMQSEVNKVVIVVVLFVLVLSGSCTIAYQFWSKDTERNSWYIAAAKVPPGNILASFIIMFNTMIPLSLYVSLEIVKVGQLLLMHDIDMYDPVTDTPMESHTTTINEELGQVSYIFSDKTGTLTDNIMRFRKMSVAGVAWLHDYDIRKEAAIASGNDGTGKGKSTQKKSFTRSSKSSFSTMGNTNTQSEAEAGNAGWNSTARPAKAQPELNTEQLLEYLRYKPHTVFARKARFFLLSLALCHTCLPEKKDDGSIDFQAASPDELALVRAAQDLGYLVIDRAAATITLKSKPNGPRGIENTEVYTVLDVIEFTSKRKRMSIIVRFPDGRRCIFCKGADSIVIKRLKMANLAIEKKVEVERRTSARKSMEAEHAMRRRSDAYNGQSPRNSISMDLGRSLDIARHSIGGVPRTSGVGNRFRPLREEVKTWLKERETDVDRTSVDNPSAYSTPRASMQLQQGRNSFASVFVDDDDYYESMVDESLAVNDAAVLERCLQHVDDFATEGLRTLLYGYRFLDETDYNSWKRVYHDATTSLVDRQEMIEAAGELIEKDFELAGATAIEDKLQKGVPETIDKLRRANIKMWMLTGDKRETAINIGQSCRLIKDYSKLVILDSLLGNVATLMSSTLRELEEDSVAHSVIVVDGQTLADIEADETLQELFFSLAVLADSVICCRASPSQKALLVKKIRQQVNRSVTLAIGDGANDIAMIQEAHVGIGITGKEGLQAARISDYSIAQFRFLQKLLLVHGRWNYVRTGKYVLGTFWKEMVFYLTQALYQRWNGYSGTSFYESWSLSMFNTLFTSLAVIFLGIFEQDLRAATLLAVPELYSQGQRNEAFNFKKYFGWMFVAVCEAMIVYFMTMGLFGWQVRDEGSNVYAISSLAYTCCVVIINMKLLGIELHSKTWVTFGAFMVTIAGWFAWLLILNYAYALKEQLAYNVRWGFVSDFGKMLEWWLTVLSVITAFLIFEVCVSGLRKMLWASDTDVFQELEKDPLLRRKFEESCSDVLADADGGRNSSESEKMREDEAEERRREDEVGDLLRLREADLRREQSRGISPERTKSSRSFGPFGAMKRQISAERSAERQLSRTKSTDGGGLMPVKTKGSMAGKSTKGRPSMDGGRSLSTDGRLNVGGFPGMGMRRKSEMGAEMTVMEEGSVAGGGSTPAAPRSEASATASHGKP